MHTPDEIMGTREKNVLSKLPIGAPVPEEGEHVGLRALVRVPELNGETVCVTGLCRGERCSRGWIGEGQRSGWSRL